MPSTFLTPDEIADLTDLQMPAYQVKWLDRNGYPFDVSAAGRPKVLRAYVEKRHGVASASKIGESEPDFSRWER